MSRKAWGTALVAGLLTVPLTVGAPNAAAINDDTHITGQGINQTIDCHGGTLFVNGTGNTINAFGTCWAVTVQGSSNTVIAAGKSLDQFDPELEKMNYLVEGVVGSI